MTEQQVNVIGKLVLSAMVCVMAGACMYLTHGETGIGWGILGLLVVWG